MRGNARPPAAPSSPQTHRLGAWHQGTLPGRLLPAVAAAIGRREFANTFWLAIGDGSGKLGLFIVNLYLARTLRPAAYGVFVIAQSLTFYAWHATDLGTTMHGTREIARRRADAPQILGSLLGLRITAGAAGTAIALAILWAWPMAPSTRLVCMGASLYLACRAIYPDYAVKGLERFKELGAGSLAVTFTFLVSSLALVHEPSGAPAAAVLWSCSWLAGAAVLSVFLVIRLHIRISPSFRPQTWLSYLRESIHFGVSGGLLLVYDSLPILLVAALFGTAGSGTFSAAYKVVITLAGVGSLMPTALFPVLSDQHAHDFGGFMRTHERFRNIMMIAGLLASVTGMALAHPIIMILLGKEYTAAIGLFRILSADLFFYSMRFTYGIALSASGNQKYYNIASLLGLAFLGITFLPAARWGLPGESVCVVTADAIVAAGLAVTLRRKVALDPRNRQLRTPSGVMP
jgi:O-antigen/teichoic acid export membrane protein